jgi:hypothetical protein
MDTIRNGVMASAPDFTGWTAAEQAAAFTAIKAEMMRRLGLGSISSGASQGQSVTMTKLSNEELRAWHDSLAPLVTGSDPITQVAPMFIT